MNTSTKTRSARKKQLPVIPAGVEPAMSPRLPQSKPALTSLAHSPLLPRSPNLSVQASKTAAPSKLSHKLPSDGEDSAVRVAVRVRPFSKREKAMGAKQVVSMSGNRTTITSTRGKAHFFCYDHCFWSVDMSCGVEGVEGCAGQQLVYKELAQPLLDNAFRGFNTCLFAYGQTGSGKSYCIMGEGEEYGIVPRFMKELFDRIEGTSDSKNTFNVQVSYFEIYNEKVYDLLSSSGKSLTPGRNRNKLRVREHQVLGPYVEDLSTYAASSYADIEHWLKIGNRCRATNATSMNDRSSRSHAVFQVTLTHTMAEREEEHNTVSRINIIDLAGSERSKVADTSGERLKEGASINRSLHSLGKVISLLSDHSTGKRDKVYIPYRDSTLTWLLKESLGGNSKTAMLATISPADTHYEESLSTLRYAQQARSIVNVARVNEDPNVKMIRELTSEIEHLREMLAVQGGEVGLAEIKNLREQLSESEKLMAEATRSWQEKLQESERRKKEELEQLKLRGALTVNNKLPNLVNLTEDPQLSETLLYVLRPGVTSVGNAAAAALTRSHDKEVKSHDIELTGALVVQDHCMFVYEEDCVLLKPSSSPDAQTYVNGQLLSAARTLHHGDRVVLGGDYFFRFNYPLEAGAVSTSKKGRKDYEFAHTELVKAQNERLEREWEEKMLKERQQMLSELEGVQITAQAEIDRQQAEYQQRLKELNLEMATQSMHLTEEQQIKQLAEQRVEELLQRNQALEEETIEQRHIIHLEKIKTEKESREMEEQHNQLMLDLELEKRRLEEDIGKLSRNKSKREVHLSPSSSNSLLTNGHSSGSESSLLPLHRGSEVVRVSVMLQEAAAICKALNKPLTFTREEGMASGTEGGAGGGLTIRVSNTLLNLVTYWDMSKFELRLEQMRDMYQTRGSLSSLEEQGTMSPLFSEDPFNAPSDSWAPSPLRSMQRSRSLQSTPSLATPTSASRPLPFDLYHTLHSKSSNYSSPRLFATPLSLPEKPEFSAAATLLAAVQQMSTLLDWKEDNGPEYLLSRLFSHVERVREDCHRLSSLLPHPTTTTTTETSSVESLAMSLCCYLQALAEGSKALHLVCQEWRLLMADWDCPLLEQTSAMDLTSQLQSTVCHKTALYCTRLMKSEGPGATEECCQEVSTSLDAVSELLGQLLLVREVQQRLLLSRTSHTPNHPSRGNDELCVHWPLPEGSMQAPLLHGVCTRCRVVIEGTLQTLHSSMSAVPHSQQWGEWLNALQQLVSSAVSFLQWLQGIQETIWVDTEEAWPVPLPPVVTMVMLLHRLATSISRLDHTHQTATDHTPDMIHAESVEAIGVCNQLAVSVLGILKTSEGGKALSAQVQMHAQLMAQAGKTINHLLKKGLFRTDTELTL